MKENLLHFWQKSNKDIVLGLMIVLLGTGSFALGRLSVTGTPQKSKIITTTIDMSGEIASRGSNTLDKSTPEGKESGVVVASKNGSKYHDPWCPGANKISEKNKISFESEALALSAGFTRASNCPK